MKSLIMKNTYAILAIFLSLQIHAQIPDSLNVDLPWEVVRVSSCDDTMGEGPKSTGSQTFVQLKSDIITEDGTGNCLVRTKTWDIFDWIGDNVYTFTQTAQINFPEPLMCEENIYVTHDMLPFTLNKDNLLLNEDENHNYSFSYTEINDVQRIITTSSESNQVFYMYDHTANRVCKTNVFKVSCEDDVVIDIPETAEVVFNGEPYIELTLDMLGAVIEYPCEDYTTKIKVGSQPNAVLQAGLIGKIVRVKVEVKVDNGTKYESYIDVNVKGVKPDPLPMYIEDKEFVAGELVAIDVWSEGVEGLLSWQLQLEFENIELLSLEGSETFGDIPENIFNDGESLKVLWFPFDAMSIDIESDQTWFTLIIKPDIDGSTLDFFKTELDPWSEILIEDENYEYEIKALFEFNVAPRDLLDLDDNDEKSKLDIFPNPASSEVYISGLPDANLPTNITIFDLEGKLMMTKTVQSNKAKTTIDISDLPTGLFVLKAQNGAVSTSQKISKI